QPCCQQLIDLIVPKQPSGEGPTGNDDLTPLPVYSTFFGGGGGDPSNPLSQDFSGGSYSTGLPGLNAPPLATPVLPPAMQEELKTSGESGDPTLLSGDALLSHALDFRQSVAGTWDSSAMYFPSPALVYDTSSAYAQPILSFSLPSDPSGPVPSSIQL